MSLGFQCEFLCFPFQESRSLLDFIAFMEEERRTAVYSMILDLYAANPQLELSWENAAFDRLGYYSEPVFEEGEVQERQAALYGGVRWRLEDHIPWEDRRLDRISLFQSIPGRTVTPELRLSDAEGNTRACPWHHNATVALASFRSALSLARNPQSAARAKDLTCPVSLPFEGTSQQLMTHGFLEPGQWF
ncbi:MAG: hypothetical protein AAF679_11620 [Pseudomonadota bacterium]